MGDEDAGEDWFDQLEPVWAATKSEALRRFPPGSRVIEAPTTEVGEVLLVDDMGDLHIRWANSGVGITSSPWSGLEVVDATD